MSENCCFCIGLFGFTVEGSETSWWCSLGACTYVNIISDYGGGSKITRDTYCTLLGSYTRMLTFERRALSDTITIVEEYTTLCTLCGCCTNHVYRDARTQKDISFLCCKASYMNNPPPKAPILIPARPPMIVPEQITMDDPQPVAMIVTRSQTRNPTKIEAKTTP